MGSKLIVHLRPNGGFRFRLPKEVRERLAGIRSIKGLIRGVEFEARIDNGFRLCLPTWIKSIMGDEGISLCLDLASDEVKLVELEGAQVAPNLNHGGILNGIPVAGSPRYRRGFGYCSRCAAAYPLIFTRCPLCNTLLRHSPRMRRKATNPYKAP